MKCPNCGRNWGEIRLWPVYCGWCNWKFTDPDHGVALTEGQQAPPSILSRGIHYLHAYRKWISAGRPVRSEDEVDTIRIICRNCEHYRDERCLKCGCGIATGSWLGDKPSWATESCPIGKW